MKNTIALTIAAAALALTACSEQTQDAADATVK